MIRASRWRLTRLKLLDMFGLMSLLDLLRNVNTWHCYIIDIVRYTYHGWYDVAHSYGFAPSQHHLLIWSCQDHPAKHCNLRQKKWIDNITEWIVL